MTLSFETPAALALLAAVPLVLLLRRRPGAQVVPVASVVPFRSAAGDPEPTSVRRRIDLVLLLTVAAITSLSLAAARPVVGLGAPRALLFVDSSPSMEALDDGGRRVGDTARDRARRLLAEAAPSLVVVESDLDPEYLGATLAALRPDGHPRAVVATDGGLPAVPELVVVGPESAAAPNAALTSAVLDGEEAVVTVENFGPREISIAVRAGDAERRVTIAPRSSAEVRFDAPPPGAGARYLLADGGSLARDDTLEVVRSGGAGAVRLEAARPAPALERILRAVTDDGRRRGTEKILVRYGGPLLREETSVLHVAPESAADDAAIPLAEEPGPASAEGIDVTGSGPLAAALPQPSTTLSVTRRPAGGETFLRDRSGPIGATARGVVVLAVDPERAPPSAASDPWLVVVVAAAFDHLAGGPDRLLPVESVPREESDLPSSVPPDPAREDLLACIRPPRAAAGGLAIALAALGALCAGAAAAAGMRRAAPRGDVRRTPPEAAGR